MKTKLKIRNPYQVAMIKRHGGGIKIERDKTRYSRKIKHKKDIDE